ncbi:hypothetical protein ACLOJK_006596 [Asimina triloba]
MAAGSVHLQIQVTQKHGDNGPISIPLSSSSTTVTTTSNPATPSSLYRYRRELPPATHRRQIGAVQQVEDDERYKDPTRPQPPLPSSATPASTAAAGAFSPTPTVSSSINDLADPAPPDLDPQENFVNEKNRDWKNRNPVAVAKNVVVKTGSIQDSWFGS